MKRLKFKRFIITAFLVFLFVAIQTTVMPEVAIASIQPNLLIIATASFGFMRGSREGMFVGLLAGLIIDVLYGDIIGFFGLMYLIIGFLNGMFEDIYLDEDIKLPILLIGGSTFVHGLVVYFIHFVFRGEFNFFHYLNQIIIPELLYTVIVAILVYPIVFWINRRLETEEKRRTSRFV